MSLFTRARRHVDMNRVKELREEKIKEDTGADIRVIPFGSEDTNSKCMYCGEKSESIPIFARGY